MYVCRWRENDIGYIPTHQLQCTPSELAKAFFKSQGILTNKLFEEVDWKSVHGTLHSLPKLFQLWASKHVLDVAGTMKFLSYQESEPQCVQVVRNVLKTVHMWSM